MLGGERVGELGLDGLFLRIPQEPVTEKTIRIGFDFGICLGLVVGCAESWRNLLEKKHTQCDENDDEYYGMTECCLPPLLCNSACSRRVWWIYSSCLEGVAVSTALRRWTRAAVYPTSYLDR